MKIKKKDEDTAQAGPTDPLSETDLKISKIGKMDPREAMKRSGGVVFEI